VSRYLLILALALLACPPIATAQTSGLRLGYWDETGQRHKTLWIHHSGDAAAAQVMSGLPIPRKTGFWHLGNYWTLTTGDEIERFGKTARYITHEEHIWALPADRQPVINRAPNERLVQDFAGDTCEDTSRQVHFAGPSYISYTVQTEYTCGVHPDGEAELCPWCR